MNVDPRDGFVDALLASPLGVSLLAVLEGGSDAHGWSSSSGTSTPASVAAAVDAVGSMTFGRLIDVAVSTAVIECGPWISDAPSKVAAAYRHAEARVPIACAIDEHFGDMLHAPLDRTAQQWWSDGPAWFESLAPLFREFEHVYGAGQFTWAGLWTVTDPPVEARDQLAGAWEYETGPVDRWWLPVRPTARVFEMHRPEDWARLVAEHPRLGGPHPEWELPGVNQHRNHVAALGDMPHQRAVRTTIGRHLVPDWRSVADQYDGVHLSWAGFLTSEGCITDTGHGDVTMLRYWFSERTHWLADVFGEPVPVPGRPIDLTAGPHPVSPRSPGDDATGLARLLGR